MVQPKWGELLSSFLPRAMDAQAFNVCSSALNAPRACAEHSPATLYLLCGVSINVGGRGRILTCRLTRPACLAVSLTETLLSFPASAFCFVQVDFLPEYRHLLPNALSLYVRLPPTHINRSQSDFIVDVQVGIPCLAPIVRAQHNVFCSGIPLIPVVRPCHSGTVRSRFTPKRVTA